MQKSFICLLVLSASLPVRSQVQASAQGGDAPIVSDDSRMTIPPQVSGTVYPTMGANEERTNYVAGSITATEAYIDNLLIGAAGPPVSDESILVSPSLTLDRTTSRQKLSLSYTPGLVVYEHTSFFNDVDQGGNANYQARLSPNITLMIQDFFLKTSNVFNTQYPYTAGGVTGSTLTPLPAVIVPFADQVRNDGTAALTYQFSRLGMVGGSGQFKSFRFPNQTQSPGVYDSDEMAASAFYSRRLSSSQYVGLNYQWDNVEEYPPGMDIHNQIESYLPFYMLSLKRRFSLSATGGAQHVLISQHQSVSFESWSPAAVVSFGWQGDRANLAASYLHTIIAGGGIAGSYHADTGSLLGGWQFTRTWNAAASVAYQIISPVVSFTGLNNSQDGHFLAGQVSVRHMFGDHFAAELGYQRLQQDYKALAVIAANPNSDREYVTVTYTFTKSLGR